MIFRHLKKCFTHRWKYPFTKKIVFLSLLFFPILTQAQTDTTAKLKDARLQWTTFNNDQTDTSIFMTISVDCAAVLSVDSLNATANQYAGNLYSTRATIYATLAQSLQSSDPSLSATYTTVSDSYSALAVPYMQRYLRIKGIH